MWDIRQIQFDRRCVSLDGNFHRARAWYQEGFALGLFFQIALALKQPGLILADIQLADGSSGLEAVNELLATFEAPVIFITAFPERFLTGERPEPAFLIAKPFQPATVSAIISQALFFERKAKRRAA